MTPSDSDPASTPIAQALWAERKHRGMGQRAAAEAAGANNQTTYQNWETAGTEPRARWYPGIMAFLGLTDDQLKDLVFEDRLARDGVPLEQLRQLSIRVSEERR